LRLCDGIADKKISAVQFLKGDDLHVALLSYKQKVSDATPL
jgi:hypothetical protein